MEFIVQAPDADREIKLIVEPWGDEIPLPTGHGLLLKVEGEDAESMSIYWFPDAVMVWPPRYTTLTVLTGEGDEISRFETKEIPELPVPPRFQT